MKDTHHQKTNQIISKILYVDDEPTNLFAMEQILKDVEADLVKASSGNEALSLILKNDFALILLDVQMPEIDGFETANLIRNDNRYKSIPIIFITAMHKEDQHVFKGYETGAVDYIFKPINPDILINKVKVFLELDMNKKLLEERKKELIIKNRILEKVNNELDSSNKNLQDFAHTVAHDLLNPIGTLQVILELLNKKDEDNINKADLLHRGIDTMERAKRLIEDLLEFSKNSKRSTQVEKIDLSHLIHEVTFDLEKLIKEKKANIQVDPLPNILGSHIQIYQVFLNLISNALKYSNQNIPPLISIHAQKIPNHKSSDPKRKKIEIVQIHIEDNGIGFDEKYADKIFDPFSRLHNSHQFEGSGIGLATVKKIISLHCGSITAKSKKGEGSTFTITLPIGLSPEAASYIRKEIRVACPNGKTLSIKIFRSSDKLYSFEVLDESKNGKRFKTNTPEHLKPGTIIEIEDDGKYEVCWINQVQKGDFHFGTKLISD